MLFIEMQSDTILICKILTYELEPYPFTLIREPENCLCLYNTNFKRWVRSLTYSNSHFLEHLINWKNVLAYVNWNPWYKEHLSGLKNRMPKRYFDSIFMFRYRNDSFFPSFYLWAFILHLKICFPFRFKKIRFQLWNQTYKLSSEQKSNSDVHITHLFHMDIPNIHYIPPTWCNKYVLE